MTAYDEQQNYNHIIGQLGRIADGLQSFNEKVTEINQKIDSLEEKIFNHHDVIKSEESEVKIMTLQELYPILGDSITLVVEDQENNQIAIYDGKDSIPDELNGKKNCLPIDIQWDLQQVVVMAII